MTKNATTDEINQVIGNALLKLRDLVNSDLPQQPDFLSVANVFLLGVISTTVDLVELSFPDSAPLMYADIEAAAKSGGLRAIRNKQSAGGGLNYSVSDIDPDDKITAMNYLGQELSTALFKGMHELPIKLRTPEMWLRGIEAMLANLLNQKFDNSQTFWIVCAITFIWRSQIWKHAKKFTNGDDEGKQGMCYVPILKNHHQN